MFNPGMSIKIIDALQNAGFEAVYVGGYDERTPAI